MKVLDSTVLIDIFKGNKSVIPIISSNQQFYTTQINMYEVIRGLFLKNISPEKFAQILELSEHIRVLPLDDNSIIKSAAISSDLMKKGIAIEDCDCLTAGITLANGIKTIVTRNIKHFERIKDLTVETY